MLSIRFARSPDAFATRTQTQVLEVHIPGRTGKQIRERWHNQIDPNVKKDKWSREEDEILIEAHSRLGTWHERDGERARAHLGVS
jgi:myb proto-oncogene protein